MTYKRKFRPEKNTHIEKMNQYCCSAMYGAVEIEANDELNISLINFQGDSIWAVTNFEAVGGNLLFSYCPWCGEKMPSTSFLEHED